MIKHIVDNSVDVGKCCVQLYHQNSEIYFRLVGIILCICSSITLDGGNNTPVMYFNHIAENTTRIS